MTKLYLLSITLIMVSAMILVSFASISQASINSFRFIIVVAYGVFVAAPWIEGWNKK